MKADTIARTVILAMALINQVLAILGRDKLPFADEDIYQVVTLLFTIASSAWAWFKNNSITKNAIKADEYLAGLKQQSKGSDGKQ